MLFAWIRLCVLGGALALMAGCGGSSGGGSGTGGSGGDNSTTVTFTITGATPTAVATSIGSASFTAATLTAGKLTLSLPSGTTNFAVAFVCPPVPVAPTPYLFEFENVFEANTLDGTSFSQSCPTAPTTVGGTGATGTLTASVDASAIPGASFLNVDAENGKALLSEYNNSPVGTFSFAAPAGTDRVAVLAYNSVLNGYEQTFSLVAVKNFTSQTVPGALNGGNAVVLGAADQTTLEPLTYKSVPSGYNAPSALVSYVMSGGSGFVITNGGASGYPAVPAGASESGDYYIVTSTAGSAKNVGEQAAVSTISSSAAPISLTFPPAWLYTGPTPAARPSFDLSYTGFAGQSDVRAGVETDWLTGSTTENIVVTTATGNYLSGSSTVAIPDFSNVTGFLSPPASGLLVIWSANVSQGSFPSAQSSPPSGTIKTVSNTGTYIVP